MFTQVYIVVCFTRTHLCAEWRAVHTVHTLLCMCREERECASCCVQDCVSAMVCSASAWSPVCAGCAANRLPQASAVGSEPYLNDEVNNNLSGLLVFIKVAGLVDRSPYFGAVVPVRAPC